MLSINDINDRRPTGSIITAIKFLDSHRLPNGKIERRLLYTCACGNTKETTVKRFMHNSKSCGCRVPAHLYRSCEKSKYPLKLRHLYTNMIGRCNNLKNKDYGGKGVRVFSGWVENRNSFFDWAIANGWKEGLQIDKDIKGDGLLYSPDTCIFVTPKVNSRARKALKKHLFNGNYMGLSEISEKTGINLKTICDRVKAGKSIEDSVRHTDRSQWAGILRLLSNIEIPKMETHQYRTMTDSAYKIIQEIKSL